MKESIFRKESLERISSPGEMNQYIRVADPGTWLMLSAIVLLLLGVLVWGIFGTIEDSVPACLSADENGAICYVSTQDALRLKEGMPVITDAGKGTITSLSLHAEALPRIAQDLLSVEIGCAVQAEFDPAVQGVHEARVIIERIAPISFVLQ